jgi:acyl carrier protein
VCKKGEEAENRPMPDERSVRGDDAEARLLRTVDALARELDAERGAQATLQASIERDLGIDSLGRVELLLRIEQAFGVHLPERTLAEAETVADLLAALRAAGRAAEAAPVAAAALAAQAAISGRPDEAETLVGALAWHVARHAERTHIVLLDDKGHQTLTYGALYQVSKRIAAGLQAHDIAGGQVAIMLPTGFDFFACFLGAQLAGAVPVPLYPPARPSQLEDHLRRHSAILANCRARVLVTLPQIKPLARLIQPQVRSLSAVLTIDELQQGTASAAFARPRGTDLALLQYTSGSTGNPKGVTLTHANVLANVRAWSDAVALTPRDVCVSWLPLYHDMGLIGTWMGSLYNACTLVLMSPLAFLARPERWLQAIDRWRGTVTAAPNFAFELLLRRAESSDFGALDLSCWRLCANGAEPVSATTIERFCERFARHGFRREAMAPVYGLAECTVGLTVPPLGRPPRIDAVRRSALLAEDRAEPAAGDDDVQLVVGCGVPLPAHEIRVVDEAGRPLAERRVGRLQFRGPSATAGYFDNPAETAKLLAEGWLDSGDLAYIAGGELFPVSRAKDVIIRGGQKLHPYELEEEVGRLPGVRKGCVAVVGARDARSGTERVVVIAETRLADTEQRRALHAKIAELAVRLLGAPADEIVLARPHSVLKTSSGKIRRAATCAAFEAGRLGAAGRAPWLQLLRLALGAARGRGAVLLERAGAVGFGLAAWGLAAAAAAPLLLLLALQRSPRRRWRTVHRFARGWLRALGMPVQARGLQHLDGGGAAVLVANHASYLDSVVLLAALREPVTFVAKRELARVPLLHWILRRLGVCFIERFDLARSVRDAGRLAELLREGRRLLVFPEGTFRRPAGLLPFHLGAFLAAAQTGAPVLPLALCGTRRLFPDRAWLPRRAALQVHVEEPLRPADSDWQAALALRDAARRRIAHSCGEAALGTAL